jgi:hypothetical protein
VYDKTRNIYTKIPDFLLTCFAYNGNIIETHNTNTVMKPSTHVSATLRELPVGARQRERRDGIPFGVALLNGQ